MRIELIYKPGCRVFKKALHLLETIIAEEQLPIPIELSESATTDQHTDSSPMIFINGQAVPWSSDTATTSGSALTHSIERLRDVLFKHWKDLTDCKVKHA